MEPLTSRFVFLRALMTHIDRLRDLLGTQWPEFRDQLQALLNELAQAKDDDHLPLLVDAIIDAGLESPAAELVRDLLRQARTAAGRFENTTRSIRMHDPTSGHNREVMIERTEKQGPQATASVVSCSEMIAAGHALSQALQAVDALHMVEPLAPPVQFTAYHPKEIRPAVWYTLLAYAHVPSALEAVQIDSRTRLGPQAGSYGKGRTPATQSIARGAEIAVIPELPGCRFNPPHATFLWLEDWHRAEFRVQATPDLPDFAMGAAVNGRVSFYVGPVLVAEVKIWAYCTEEANTSTADCPTTHASADAYQAIFPSYSHTDTAIVEQLEKAYTVLGIQSLRDVHTLRSGEEWNTVLLRKIEEADIFQLYWSHDAKRSPYVEQEWRHALTQARRSFIRPVYWEQPLPQPPPELASFHFTYFELKE